jgi:hypothetical protein
VRELVPSAEIVNDPADVHEWPIDRVEIGNIPIEADGARPLSFDEFLVDTSTDGSSLPTRCWREVDSNPRSPPEGQWLSTPLWQCQVGSSCRAGSSLSR